jgi:hypothetical protein
MSGINLLNAGNLESYSKLFLNGNGLTSLKYTRVASDDDHNRIAALGNDNEVIDSPLEIALLSTCAGVVDVRPAMSPEVAAILPANNPKLSDLKLGAAVYQEMQVLRFLGNTNAVGRHEGIIKFITDRGNVSRVEIDAFYRQNIGASIAELVKEKLNEKRNGYVPAEVYAGWKRLGADDAQALMIDAITRFYLEPSQTTLRKLIEIHARQYTLGVHGDLFARTGEDAFLSILNTLNPSLRDKVGLTGLGLNIEVATLDPRYRVFSTPYDVGGGR